MKQFWDLKKLKMLPFNRSSLIYWLTGTNFYSAIKVAVIMKVHGREVDDGLTTGTRVTHLIL